MSTLSRWTICSQWRVMGQAGLTPATPDIIPHHCCPVLTWMNQESSPKCCNVTAYFKIKAPSLPFFSHIHHIYNVCERSEIRAVRVLVWQRLLMRFIRDYFHQRAKPSKTHAIYFCSENCNNWAPAAQPLFTSF